MKLKKIKLISLLSLLTFQLHAQSDKITFHELDSIALKMKSISYKEADGDTLKLLYQLPRNSKKNKKYPAIIFIHGGAWMGGTAETLAPYAAYFSHRNMVGISIEYRLLKNEKSDILNCITDCKSAIRYLKSHSNELQIDTNKIVISGESAGGHLAVSMALLNGFDDPKEINSKIPTNPQALILLNPVVNLTTQTFIKYLDAKLVKGKQKIPDSATLQTRYYERAKSISPLFQIHHALPPTLLINGEKDVTTPANEAISFANTANKFSNNCKIILIPETGHAFAVPHYRESEQRAVNTILMMDGFLKELQLISGNSPIVNSNDPTWIHKR